jgi:hypothetical protein
MPRFKFGKTAKIVTAVSVIGIGALVLTVFLLPGSGLILPAGAKPFQGGKFIVYHCPENNTGWYGTLIKDRTNTGASYTIGYNCVFKLSTTEAKLAATLGMPLYLSNGTPRTFLANYTMPQAVNGKINYDYPICFCIVCHTKPDGWCMTWMVYMPLSQIESVINSWNGNNVNGKI